VLFYQWSASNGSTTIDKPSVEETFFKIPAGAGSMDVDITLTVSDGKFQDVETRSDRSQTWPIITSSGLLAKETSGSSDNRMAW
jgi:hypothetical protein